MQGGSLGMTLGTNSPLQYLGGKKDGERGAQHSQVLPG
jgi:hypothetical protein